jgi:hypothetical protein
MEAWKTRRIRVNLEEWLDEFVAWLEGFPWCWFCSLTFCPGLSPAQARWRLRKWADALRDALGTSDFQWIAVPEHGRTGMDFHYHVLIAGLRECHAPQRVEWMRRSGKIGGDALIDTYKSDARGVRYILKHVNPNDMDNLELHLNARTQLQTNLATK